MQPERRSCRDHRDPATSQRLCGLMRCGRDQEPQQWRVSLSGEGRALHWTGSISVETCTRGCFVRTRCIGFLGARAESPCAFNDTNLTHKVRATSWAPAPREPGQISGWECTFPPKGRRNRF